MTGVYEIEDTTSVDALPAMLHGKTQPTPVTDEEIRRIGPQHEQQIYSLVSLK